MSGIPVKHRHRVGKKGKSGKYVGIANNIRAVKSTAYAEGTKCYVCGKFKLWKSYKQIPEWPANKAICRRCEKKAPHS